MKVPNTKRRFGESGDYIFAKINGYDALLTHYEAQVAIDRAKRQREDVPSRFRRFLNWLNRI